MSVTLFTPLYPPVAYACVCIPHIYITNQSSSALGETHSIDLFASLNKIYLGSAIRG